MIKKPYTTNSKHGSLYFKITEGQFKDVEYKYISLTENGGLKYQVTSNKKAVNENNKYLFEHQIKDILNDKLGLKNV